MAEKRDSNPCESCHDLPICPGIDDPNSCSRWVEENRHRRLVDFWRIVMGKDPIYYHGPAFEEAAT